MYEYFDLGLIVITLLFSALSLLRVNLLKERMDKLEDIIKLSATNPRLARKLLNQLNQ
mgnify:CR=1 FL=1